MSTLLCIDYGTRKSWLAYSVEGFAFTYKTVSTREIIWEIEKLISEKSPKSIILGMPYHIDGSMSLHGKRVQTFEKELRKYFSLPIILHDERLSTSEARIHFSESGQSGDVDAEAARLILEDYIKQVER